MKTILITNDDGIHAPGLAAMETELQAIGDVTVIAPQIEQSNKRSGKTRRSK